jgi:hypothetical protein
VSLARRVTSWSVFAGALLTPLAYLPGRSQPVLEQPKMWVATASLLVAAVGLLAQCRRAALLAAVRRPPADLVALVVIAALTVVAICTSSARVVWPDALRIVTLLLMLAVTRRSPDARAAATRGVAVASACIAVLVLAEEWGWTAPGLALWQHSPAATLGHRNVAAHLFLGGIPIFLAALAATPKQQNGRALALAWLFGICCAALVACRSRTAFVAGVLEVLLVLWGVRRSVAVPWRKLAFASLALACASTLHLLSPMTTRLPVDAVGLAPAPAQSIATRHRARLAPSRRGRRPTFRFADAPQPLSERLTPPSWRGDGPLLVRVDIWKSALSILREHPLRGLGPGRFRMVNGYWNAHQLWLQLGVDFGAVVMVLALLFSAVLAGLALKRLTRPREPHLAAAAATVCAYLVAGAIDTGALHWGSNLAFGAAAGALAGDRDSCAA